MSKRDEGKPPIQLIEPSYILGLAKVLGFGAEKYGPNDWKNNVPENVIDRTFGSVQRHLWQWKGGEKQDSESGLPHLLHAACQLMMLYWYDNNVKEEPKPKKGAKNEL